MKTLRWFTLAAPILTVACHDSILLGGDGGTTENATAQAQGGPIDASAPVVDDAGITLDASRGEDVVVGLDANLTFDAMPAQNVYFYGNPVSQGQVFGVPLAGYSPLAEPKWASAAPPISLASGDGSHDVGAAIAPGSGCIGSAPAPEACPVVYFTSEDFGPGGGFTYSIGEVPGQGGSARTLVAGLDTVVALAAGEPGELYFLDQAQATIDPDSGLEVPHGHVERVGVTPDGVATGAPQVLASVDASLGALALDTTYVYWTQTTAGANGAHSGSVVRAPLAGGAVETLASDQASPRAIALGGGNVYWLNYGTMQVDCTATDGSLVELPANTSTPVVLLSNLKGAKSLAGGGDTMFVTELGSFCNSGGTTSGSVIAFTPSSGKTVSLATGLSGPSNLYFDGRFLFFTTVADTSTDTLSVTALQP